MTIYCFSLHHQIWTISESWIENWNISNIRIYRMAICSYERCILYLNWTAFYKYIVIRIVKELSIWYFNLISKLSWDCTHTCIIAKLNVLVNIKWTSSRDSHYRGFRAFTILKFRTFIYCQVTLLLHREKTCVNIKRQLILFIYIVDSDIRGSYYWLEYCDSIVD